MKRARELVDPAGMSYQSVVGMLNPAMSAIFCLALFVLWYHHRRLTYIAIFVLSYAMRMMCFGILYFSFVHQEPVLRQLSNALMLFATMLFSVALSNRREQRPRYGALLAIGAISLAVLYFYQFVEPNLPARVVALNLGLTAISLLMLLDVANFLKRTQVEQLLFGLILVTCLGFLIRPLVFLVPNIAAAQMEGNYWLVVSISDALLCAILAVAIFAVVAVDVMENIKWEAQVDVLSGLFNRRGFEARALDALARQTNVAPLAMILSDLDDFKSINDRFGHVSGDSVIRSFSRILKEKAPRGAIVARLGGEEFAILLPPGYALTANFLAEAARSAFKEVSLGIVWGKIYPTASFGIAVAREDEGLQTLIDRADRALYQAKNDGRDCIRQVG